MPRLSDNLRTTYTADGAVVLDIVRGRIFTFNQTGSRILQLVGSGMNSREISLTLVREFSAEPENADADTVEFLGLLHQHALLEY